MLSSFRLLTLREELLPKNTSKIIKNLLRRSLPHGLLSLVHVCPPFVQYVPFSRITYLTASEDRRKLPRGIGRLLPCRGRFFSDDRNIEDVAAQVLNEVDAVAMWKS